MSEPIWLGPRPPTRAEWREMQDLFGPSLSGYRCCAFVRERKVRTPQGRVTANGRTQQTIERSSKARNRATETSKRGKPRGRETRQPPPGATPNRRAISFAEQGVPSDARG